MDTDKRLFTIQKQECLKGADLSRKGSIDAPIKHLVDVINSQEQYFTTSSCSGRIAMFEYLLIAITDTVIAQTAAGRVRKQGCVWLHMTHEEADTADVEAAVEKSQGNAFFKFEPFVLHVQCVSLHHAQQVLAEAVASGHRNSGISVSRKGKIVVAVRSTHGLEIPLTDDGRCMVSDEYLKYITSLGNAKMKENRLRIARFEECLNKLLSNRDKDWKVESRKISAKEKRHKKGAAAGSTTSHNSTDTVTSKTNDCDEISTGDRDVAGKHSHADFTVKMVAEQSYCDVTDTQNSQSENIESLFDCDT